MADHKHGEMNVETHEKTFDKFMSFTMKTVMVIIGILLFLLVFAS